MRESQRQPQDQPQGRRAYPAQPQPVEGQIGLGKADRAFQMQGSGGSGGQSAEEAARSALGEAVGEAVFDVYPLCAYGVTEENGKEGGGFCYVADVREWPDEAADEARAFDRLPLSSQMDRPALILALHKWAGEWFDARITLERLGQPGPF